MNFKQLSCRIIDEEEAVKKKHFAQSDALYKLSSHIVVV